MCRAACRTAVLLSLAAICLPARADYPAAAAASEDAAVSVTLAAVRVAEDDRPGATAELDAARASVDQALADIVQTTTRTRLDTLAARIGAARDRVADPSVSDAAAVRSIRRAARKADGVAYALRKMAGGPDLREPRVGDGFHRRGSRVTLYLTQCAETPVVSVTNASPGAATRTFDPAVEIRPGRVRVTLGPDLGGVRVSVTGCGVTREAVLFDLGPRRALSVEPPAAPPYASGTVRLRAGVASAGVAPAAADGIEEFDVATPLPSGLSIDPRTGVVSGTPTAAFPTADYAVIGRNRRGASTTTLTIQVTPALPPEVVALEDGFQIAAVAQGLDVPVKMAFAPDGRLFFTELATGLIRVVHADGTLVAAPFATVPVLTGGERGLLGIALANDFATSGHVFVYAATAAEDKLSDRGRILRYTATGDTGGQMTVVVDDLPLALTQNGGDLAVGPDGKLYLTTGDTMDPALAQLDGSRAGRVLRFEPDGSIPADNPVPGDPEWCRGLRNSFGLAFHPTTGGLFASENGPAAHDEIDFVQKGRNFLWGAAPESVPGPVVGIRIIDWPTVIVPTGITFLAHGAFGSPYDTSLFVAGYDQADLRRLVVSGVQFTDLDDELTFARWKDEGIENKPLDVAEAPDGSLYVSTFTAIWRISRY